MELLIELFIAFFQIDCLRLVVGLPHYHWLNVLLFHNISGLALNSSHTWSLYLKWHQVPLQWMQVPLLEIKWQGLLGGLIATIGVIVPSFIIVIVFAKVYYKYRDLQAVNSVLNGLRPLL